MLELYLSTLCILSKFYPMELFYGTTSIPILWPLFLPPPPLGGRREETKKKKKQKTTNFIFSHLINKIFPGTIDAQLITTVKRILHPSGVPRGVLLAVNAARAIGANVRHIRTLHWTDPNKKVCKI